MVDTVQRSISVHYNALSATAALKNHLEWKKIVIFKTITTDEDTVPMQFDNRD